MSFGPPMPQIPVDLRYGTEEEQLDAVQQRAHLAALQAAQLANSPTGVDEFVAVKSYSPPHAVRPTGMSSLDLANQNEELEELRRELSSLEARFGRGLRLGKKKRTKRKRTKRKRTKRKRTKRTRTNTRRKRH